MQSSPRAGVVEHELREKRWRQQFNTWRRRARGPWDQSLVLGKAHVESIPTHLCVYTLTPRSLPLSYLGQNLPTRALRLCLQCVEVDIARFRSHEFRPGSFRPADSRRVMTTIYATFAARELQWWGSFSPLGGGGGQFPVHLDLFRVYLGSTLIWSSWPAMSCTCSD